MAPKTKMGRPSKESQNIANDLLDSLKDLLSLEDEVNSRLFTALDIEKKINDTIESHINSKRTGLKVDENVGKTAVERVKLEAKLLKFTDKQLQSVYKLGTGFTNLVKNARAFISVLLANPFLAIGAAILAAGKFLFGLVKDSQELRRNFGVTAIEAVKIQGALEAAKFAAKGFLLDSEDVKNTFDALANKFGEINLETVAFSLELTRTARNLGISNENAVDLLATITAATGESKRLAMDSLNTLTNFAKLEGVAPGVVIKDLSNNAELFASFIGRGEENLIKAASAARKVGLEFNNIVGLGDDLLDVTDRLQKEQTLSIILGRQVSLQRFAVLNAQGKVAEAQRELASQLRGIEGLSAQQVRFAAGAVNLTVEELIKIRALLTQGNRDRKSLYVN
jgi:hypothetical protein